MNILLDTHAVKWFFDDDKRLPKSAIEAIYTPESNIYISMASIWEMAIKLSIGKLQLNGGIANFFDAINDNGFRLLDITPEHTIEVIKMPFIHRDPFDRMLIAQAMIEDMVIMTIDTNITKYEVKTIW